MALFKSRKGSDEPQAGARQAESIETMRRRAKHRLIGASVLVVVGVVGFTLLFDTQPRPISVDIPIEIPDRNKVKPLALPAPAPAPDLTQMPPAPTPAAEISQAPAQGPAASGAIAASPAPAAAPAPAPAATVAKAEPVAPKAEARHAEPVAPKAEVRPEPRPEPKAASDASKAQALLDGKPLATTPVIAEGRFVVQVGSFSDNVKAREARQKLEHAGMKTYTQVVDKDGKRLIRVRVGPFVNRVDAERAADRVKGMDLQAAILTL